MPETPYNLGENAKLYYSETPVTSTSYGSLPDDVLEAIKDVKLVAKHDKPERTTRRSNGKKTFAVSLTELGITFQLEVPGQSEADSDVLAAYAAFRDAWRDKTELAVFALNDTKDVDGAEGPAGNWQVADFSRAEGNGEVIFMNVELVPSGFNDWHVVGES